MINEHNGIDLHDMHQEEILNPTLPESEMEIQDAQDMEDDEQDQFLHDGEADGDALASAGFGTDEDYGCFGGDE